MVPTNLGTTEGYTQLNVERPGAYIVYHKAPEGALVIVVQRGDYIPKVLNLLARRVYERR